MDLTPASAGGAGLCGGGRRRVIVRRCTRSRARIASACKSGGSDCRNSSLAVRRISSRISGCVIVARNVALSTGAAEAGGRSTSDRSCPTYSLTISECISSGKSRRTPGSIPVTATNSDSDIPYRVAASEMAAIPNDSPCGIGGTSGSDSEGSRSFDLPSSSATNPSSASFISSGDGATASIPSSSPLESSPFS